MNGLVTVFGGTGFVGTQVVRALARQGWRIRVAARHPRRGFRLLPYGDVGQIQLVAADLTRPDTIAAALEGAQACINLVGVLYATPGRGFKKIHQDGATFIAEAAAAKGVTRFVQVSAIGADPKGRAAYARTKAAAEAAVRRFMPQAVILRPSIVFGSEDAFFNKFAAMAAFAPALPLIRGGKTKFQPVFVGDVAQAVAVALQGEDAAGRTFELGGPTVYSFKELLQLVLRETGRKRFLAPIPFPIADLLALAGDLQALVWMPPVLTTDQLRLLKTDNVVTPGALGLEALGIQPTSVEAITPSYLWRYRRGGQYADVVPA
jgi:NADH dehydrogenase